MVKGCGKAAPLREKKILREIAPQLADSRAKRSFYGKIHQ